MGQAKRRGTFEERKKMVVDREKARLVAIEENRQRQHWQERGAYKIMVWWQIEMSEERHARIMRAKIKSQMDWASLYGMIYGMGWNSFSHMYR